MEQKIRATDKASATLTCNTSSKSGLTIHGHFDVECIDADGSLKWRESVDNLVVNEGLDHILDTQFTGSAQVDPWYVLLKETGAVVAGDTLASHSNWTEFTNYTGNRQAFVEAAASGQSLDNSGSPAAFPILGTATIAGAGLASVDTGTGGTLFSAVDFASSRAVANGDTINVTYTVSSADDGV